MEPKFEPFTADMLVTLSLLVALAKAESIAEVHAITRQLGRLLPGLSENQSALVELAALELLE